MNEEILEILVSFKFNLALIIDKLNELHLTEKFFSILNTKDLRLIKYILLNNYEKYKTKEEIINMVLDSYLPEKRMILDKYEEDIKTKKPKLI